MSCKCAFAAHASSSEIHPFFNFFAWRRQDPISAEKGQSRNYHAIDVVQKNCDAIATFHVQIASEKIHAVVSTRITMSGRLKMPEICQTWDPASVENTTR